MTWHPEMPEEYKNAIVTGDARELSKRIPDESIDLIFTSPPFKDEDVLGDYWAFYDALFSEMWRVADKALIIIHSATKQNEIINRYPPKRTMIWAKGFSHYSWRYNPIFVYQKDREYSVNKRIWSDHFGAQALYGDDKLHKYQDPEVLYVAIIRMFPECQLVLDPCCGSGTVPAVCKMLGRNYIAFEIDPDTAELARERVRNTQPPLFVMEPEQIELGLGVVANDES